MEICNATSPVSAGELWGSIVYMHMVCAVTCYQSTRVPVKPKNMVHQSNKGLLQGCARDAEGTCVVCRRESPPFPPGTHHPRGRLSLVLSFFSLHDARRLRHILSPFSNPRHHPFIPPLHPIHPSSLHPSSTHTPTPHPPQHSHSGVSVETPHPPPSACFNTLPQCSSAKATRRQSPHCRLPTTPVPPCRPWRRRP